MKKPVLCMLLLLCVLSAAGCRKEEIFITSEDVTTNTMLVKRNGQIQTAIVEDFSKTYYNLTELNEFVSKEVKAYNQKAGSDEVVIEDLELKNGKAVMILSFSGMAHYSAFNNVSAAYFSTDTKNVAIELPEQYVSTKNGSRVNREEAMKNGKNQVLVVYEPYEIIVEGDIKYYSENASLGEDNRLDSIGEEATVVIYKPY